MRRISLLLAVILIPVTSCWFLDLFAAGPTPTMAPTPALRAPTPTHAAPTLVPTPVRVTVVAFEHLYLRAGAGMQYAASAHVLNWGDVLTFEGLCSVDATNTPWLYVRDSNGELGWVSQRYVTPMLCLPH